ncbi:transcription factor HES-5-like [Stigmatopora nigra]
MAPSISLQDSPRVTTVTHKIRKPLVEKLRRERINGCIEQLKSLLASEFLQQQPDSKMEKADVLEMTVCVLRRLRAHRTEAKEDFGGSHDEEKKTRRGVGKNPAESSPWRPW